MGTDEQWIAEQPIFDRFVQLPDETWEIRSERIRARHEMQAVAPVEALLALQEFCVDAHMLVAYNGTEADFPLLTEAYEREGLPTLDLAPVDAYFLALTLWPTADNHRLAPLAESLGVDREGLGWHDAVDDCFLLQRLLEYAGQVLTRWDSGLLDLVTSVCPDSLAWTLLRHLAGKSAGLAPGRLLGTATDYGHGDVAGVLQGDAQSRFPISGASLRILWVLFLSGCVVAGGVR